jgi:Glycosyl hydrolase family 76
MQKKILSAFFYFIFLCICSNIYAQAAKASYSKRIEILYGNIYKYFYDSTAKLFTETDQRQKDTKPFSYLWPLCALIQATNEVEGLTKKNVYMQPVIHAIDQYYSVKPPAPGYEAYIVSKGGDDRFYDDNQWIGIAYMDAYNRTKNEFFLKKSEEIYRFMMTGFNTRGGGGLYWKEHDSTTKNTCSNGPGILLALQLYKNTKQQNYLDTALLLYQWTNRQLLAAEGVYYDHIKFPSLTIDKRFYTYNTGTMLESNVLLFEITGNKNYLQEAKRLAIASLKQFYKNKRFPNHYWFNAVLLRGYLALYRHDENKHFINAMIADGERIWNKERDANNLIGEKQRKELIAQAAMIEIYARLAAWEKGM